MARSLKIPINPEFDRLVSVKKLPKIIKFKDITFAILGPTQKNLDKLRKDWQDWLNKMNLTQDVEFELLQILDKSIPNLSSIMLPVESKSKKRARKGRWIFFFTNPS